jgi:mono/diheme cytochrome c family protein
MSDRGHHAGRWPKVGGNREMLLRTLLVAIALCVLGSAAHAQTPSAIARGQEIAERACAGCHATNGQQPGTIQGIPVPSLRAIASRPNQTPQRLQSIIMTPHRPMPGIPLALADVDDVVAYILSLK